MNKLYKNVLFASKIEPKPGQETPPTPSKDSMLIANMQHEVIETDTVERKVSRGALGNAGKLTAAKRAKFSYEIEAVGSGTAGVAPAYASQLLRSGLAETIDAAGGKVIYTPISTGWSTTTDYYYLDGILCRSISTCSDLELSLVSGEIPTFKFDCKGLYLPAKDVPLPALTASSAFMQPQVVNFDNTPDWSFDTYSGPLKSFSLKMGNDVQHFNLVKQESIQIVDRKPGGQIVVALPSIAERDWFVSVLTNSTAPLKISHGTIAGRKVSVVVPHASLSSPKLSEEKGVAMITLDYAAEIGVGNDELQIIFE